MRNNPKTAEEMYSDTRSSCMSYSDFLFLQNEDLRKQIERLQDENKQIKERLADAEHILDEMGWADRGLIDDYAEKWKWGVK
jgi:hypothetical protein